MQFGEALFFLLEIYLLYEVNFPPPAAPLIPPKLKFTVSIYIIQTLCRYRPHSKQYSSKKSGSALKVCTI